MDRFNIVENLREYNLKKSIKNQLKVINPLLSQNERDIKVHLMNALANGLITQSELDFLQIKLDLGRMCLDLEEVLDDIYVAILFYDEEGNQVFHGAGPSLPVEYSDFYNMINNNDLFDENCCSCGRAIYTQEVVHTDISTNTLWSNFRNNVIKYGFKSCTSIPFFTQTGQVAGTFGLLSTQLNNYLTKDEIEMVQEKVAMFSVEIQTISDRIDEYTEVGISRLTI